MAAGTTRENKTILSAEDRTGGAFASFTANIARAQSGILALTGGPLGLLATGAATAFGAMVKSSLDAAEALNKASQKTGIAVAELSQLSYAAQLADVSNESLVKGVKGLSEVMVKAKDATSLEAATLRALGVDVNAGTAPAMNKLAEAFAALPDGATKTALAVDLFGKAGMDMIPMLNQGADGLARMKQEAADMGLTISSQVAADAERFNDNIKAMGAAAKATGLALASNMAAGLADVTEAMKAAQRDGGLLLATFVGLGGAAQKTWEALTGTGGTEIEKTERKIAELKDRMRELHDRMESVSHISGPMGDRMREGMVAAAIKGVNELAKLNRELAEYYRLQEAAAGKKKADDDAKAAREKEIDAIRRQHEAAKKAAEETRRYNEKLRQEDVKGWVAYAEAVFAEADRLNTELAAISDKYWNEEDKKKQEDIKGWVAYAEAVFEEADQMNRDLAKVNAEYWAGVDRERERAARDTARTWDELADFGGRSLADLALNGRSAFDRLKDSLKSFAAELIALFAKKWILNVAADMTGNSGLAALAGSTGQGSMAGSLLNILGMGSGAGGVLSGIGGMAATGLSAIGLGGASQFVGGLTGSIVGPALPGSALAMGQSVGSFISAAGPYAAALAAAYALYKAFAPARGGPKEGGSFFGQFSGAGALQSGQGGQWYGVHTADSAVQSIVTNTAQTIAQMIARFGGSSSGFGIQFGYDTDPRGTAPNRLKGILTGAGGQTLYDANYDFARGDPSGQLQLEMARMMVAAIKNSNVEREIKALFDGFDLGSSTLDGINALMAQAEDLNAVLNGLAQNTIGGITLDAVRAAQQAGESLGDTFARMVGEFQKVEAAFQQSVAGILQTASSIYGGQYANAFARSKLEGTFAQWQALRNASGFAENFSFDEMLQHFQLIGQQGPGWLTSAIESIRGSMGVAGVQLLQTLFSDYQSYLQTLGTTTQTTTTSISDFGGAVDNIVGQLLSAQTNLAGYLNGLNQSDLSPLNPQQRYAEARRVFMEQLGLAQGGNIDALGGLSGYHQAFLQASRGIYASSGQYNADYFSTYNQLASLTGGQVGPLTGAQFSAGNAAVVAELKTLREQAAATGERHVAAIVALAEVVAHVAEESDAETQARLDALIVETRRPNMTGVA